MEYVLIGIAVVMFFGIVMFPIINYMLLHKEKPYTNKDLIDHLAEDLHSEFGIKIYNE